jgi:hypothetical protein
MFTLIIGYYTATMQFRLEFPYLDVKTFYKETTCTFVMTLYCIALSAAAAAAVVVLVAVAEVVVVVVVVSVVVYHYG